MSEKDTPVIDPAVEKEIDSALADQDIIGGYMGGSGEERIPIVESYLPNGDEWQGKTIITRQEAIDHALAKNMVEVFPELKPIEGFLINSINDLEMLLTSVEGKSRNEYMEIIRGMFGAGKVENEESISAVHAALAGQMNKENDD